MLRRKATIDEIAEKAGVSKATVSNVFNGKGRFSEEVRIRVLSAATELRFTPNALIRSLQTRKTDTIGVRTWPTFTDLLASTISIYLHQGIVDGLGEAGYDLLNFIDSVKRPAPNQAMQFSDGRVDGIIIGPGILSHAELQTLGDLGLPAVVLYHPVAPASIGAICIDNAQGIELALNHMISLGHQNIAGYFPGDSYDMAERRTAFEAVQASTGEKENVVQVLSPLDYRTSMDTFCDWLISLPHLPTAILFGDDHIAFQGITALEQRGMRVPQDISVIGFDDAPRAADCGLTTIRQPARDVGHAAAKMVVRIIQEGPAFAEHILLPVELQVRGSTTPPAR